jgi:hypothetical protein
MNTKPKSQFTSLPQEDRTLILKLCSEHDYSEVVEILRKPRSEGGLNIHTSRAALCRFFTNSNPEPTLALLAQFAAAANIRHEQSSNAFLGAIRATVEARILENLRAGKPLSDMERDFRFLKTAEHLYLADAKFRAQHPKTASAAFKSHIQRCADAPDLDFVRADEPQPNSPDLESIPQDLSDLDQEILKVRKRHQDTLTALQSAGLSPEDFKTHPSEIDPASIPLLAKLKPRLTPAAPSSAPQFHPKSPVIPPIPGNSTKRRPASSTFSSPPTTQPNPTPPKPHIAPPKPGRNDPCPCGSGRKAKKCCHR